MKDIEKIKCSKCGFSNVLGTKKCVKCKTKLEINLMEEKEEC